MKRRDFLKYLSSIPLFGSLFAQGESGASELPVCRKIDHLGDIDTSKVKSTQLDEDMLIKALNRCEYTCGPTRMWLTKDCLDTFKKTGVLPEYVEFGQEYGDMKLVEVERI